MEVLLIKGVDREKEQEMGLLSLTMFHYCNVLTELSLPQEAFGS